MLSIFAKNLRVFIFCVFFNKVCRRHGKSFSNKCIAWQEYMCISEC